jgi:hypothetical protein
MKKEHGSARLEMVAVGAFAGGFRNLGTTHGAGFICHDEKGELRYWRVEV